MKIDKESRDREEFPSGTNMTWFYCMLPSNSMVVIPLKGARRIDEVEIENEYCSMGKSRLFRRQWI